MRKTGIFLVVVSVALLALPAWAQDEAGPVGRIYVLTPKTDMGDKLEQGIKKHRAWHRQQNDTWSWLTWEVVTGKNIGRLVTGTFGHHWDEFDNPGVDPKADDADVAINIAPYVKSTDSSIWIYLPKVSRPAAGEEPHKLLEVWTLHLNLGHARQFNHLMEKIYQAAKKTEWPVNYEWYTLASGGEHPTFAVVVPHDKWADFKEPEVSFDAMLEKALGRQEASMLMKQLDKAIHCESSELLEYQPALSYEAPSEGM